MIEMISTKVPTCVFIQYFYYPDIDVASKISHGIRLLSWNLG